VFAGKRELGRSLKFVQFETGFLLRSTEFFGCALRRLRVVEGYHKNFKSDFTDTP